MTPPTSPFLKEDILDDSPLSSSETHSPYGLLAVKKTEVRKPLIPTTTKVFSS